MKIKELTPEISENTRGKSGITLIALIITIIVLLILAGVALATLTGQGNIIGNAENAVGKYNNSVAREQQLLNEIEKYLIEHSNNGTSVPHITSETLKPSTGVIGSNYSATINAENNPTKWEITAGTLPNGLNLNESTGEIIGIPLTEGMFTFTVTASNENGSDSKEFSIDIIMPDNTPPTISAGNVDRTSANDVKITFVSDEEGWYYYTILDNDIEEPDVNTDEGGILCSVGENKISLTNIKDNNEKYIYIVVKDVSGNVSNKLKMEIPMFMETRITGQPADVTVKEGTSFVFGLSADGINLTYQWQLSTDGGDSWDNIPNANKSTCDVLNVTMDMTGYEYRCIVTGEYGVVISKSALLTVTVNVNLPSISIRY